MNNEQRTMNKKQKTKNKKQKTKQNKTKQNKKTKKQKKQNKNAAPAGKTFDVFCISTLFLPVPDNFFFYIPSTF